MNKLWEFQTLISFSIDAVFLLEIDSLGELLLKKSLCVVGVVVN